jgi:hypothetical protein
MQRNSIMSKCLLSLVVVTLAATAASAQVVVRAPFVRVETGGGYTAVRAPFVNLFIPSAPPVYYGPPPGVYLPGPPPFPQPNPGMATLPPPRTVPLPPPPGPVAPKAVPPASVEPPVQPDLTPPAPIQPPKAPTIDEFVKSFKPKAGNYEVTLTNPVNRQAEIVRFSLPGEPQRVRTTRNSIEFVYGPRQFVRIEFDQDGPMIISR